VTLAYPLPTYPPANHPQTSFAVNASDVTTSNGLITRAPCREAVCAPIQFPAKAPTPTHNPKDQITRPPSANTITLATLLVTFSNLVKAVARVSPNPRTDTRAVA